MVSDRILDPWLHGAMQTVRRVPEYGAYLNQAMARGTWYAFGPTRHTAHFDLATNRVVFNESLYYDSLYVVAAIILHESIHALRQIVYPDTRAGALIAFEEEITAFSYQAAYWDQVREGFVGAGVATAGINEHERLWSHWRRRALPEYVLLSKTYQEFAFGRPING